MTFFFQSTSAHSILGALAIMRYTNLRFTHLLTATLTHNECCLLSVQWCDTEASITSVTVTMNIVCAAVWRSISRQLSAVRWVRSARQCHYDNCCKSNLTYILICDYYQQIEAVTHHDTSLSSAVSEARSVGHSLTTPKCNTALVTCAGSVLKLNWRPLCQTNHNFLAVFL